MDVPRPSVARRRLIRRLIAAVVANVQPGQIAEIDTRNVVMSGRVVRINPAVQEDTMAVDVALEGELPRGARPDLTVVGTLEIERLDDVLYVGRPGISRSAR